MQNSQITKAGYFIVLFITILLLPVNAFSTAQLANNWLDEPVTIRFQDEPLNKVLEKVSKQTGIAILYDQELANEKVSGNYKDVKASDAITRLFSGKNKSIQVSKDKKVFVVKTFGAKDYIWAGSSEQDSENIGFTSITLKDLDELQAKQYQLYKQRVADDTEVLHLDEDGEKMTRGKLRAMQEQQYKKHEERVAADDEVIYVTDNGQNVTRGELRTMHEQQHNNYEKRIAEGSNIINLDENGESITRSNLLYMQEQQHKNYKERIARDDGSLKLGGGDSSITRGELALLHQKQNNAYKKRLKDRTRIIQ